MIKKIRTDRGGLLTRHSYPPSHRRPLNPKARFTSVLETVGKGFAKGLKWAVEYAVPVEKLVGLLFPAAAPAANEVADATSLIQTAVLLVEQKYAASGVQSGTGAQKLSEVMLLTEQSVTALLAKAGSAVARRRSALDRRTIVTTVCGAPEAAPSPARLFRLP